MPTSEGISPRVIWCVSRKTRPFHPSFTQNTVIAGLHWPLGAEVCGRLPANSLPAKVSTSFPSCEATSPPSYVLWLSCLNVSTRLHNFTQSDVCCLSQATRLSRYFWISPNIIAPTEDVFFVQIFLSAIPSPGPISLYLPCLIYWKYSHTCWQFVEEGWGRG